MPKHWNHVTMYLRCLKYYSPLNYEVIQISSLKIMFMFSIHSSENHEPLSLIKHSASKTHSDLCRPHLSQIEKQTCLAEPNGKGKRKMWYDILFLRYNVALSRRAYTKYRTWHDLFFFLHLYNGTGQLKLFHLFVEFEGNIFADFIYKLSRVSFDGKLKIMAQKD